jgi:hypothetical protein
VDAVSDEEESMAADDASEEAEEVQEPKRSSKGRAAGGAVEPAPAGLSKGKKRGSAGDAEGDARAKRPRKEREGRGAKAAGTKARGAAGADEPVRGAKDAAQAEQQGGKARGAKDADAKQSSKAARARPQEDEEEAEEARRLHVPTPKDRRGKAASGKGAAKGTAKAEDPADGGAGKRRPEPARQGPADASGAVQLTVEERRGLRSRVTTLAAASMSESALTAAPTVSPRKHALTAADFFKREAPPPGRSAQASRAAKPAKAGSRRGPAAHHTE